MSSIVGGRCFFSRTGRSRGWLGGRQGGDAGLQKLRDCVFQFLVAVDRTQLDASNQLIGYFKRRFHFSILPVMSIFDSVAVSTPNRVWAIAIGTVFFFI
jgi:hypothetical protein